MKLLPTNCDLFSLLWWDLTSQWWLGAVGTSCWCCMHLYVSGIAELGVLLRWHTSWWNVRFLIVIKFTKDKIMADVSFCQSRTESLKCDMMYYERVSVNTIPVNMSKDWRTRPFMVMLKTTWYECCITKLFSLNAEHESYEFLLPLYKMKR